MAHPTDARPVDTLGQAGDGCSYVGQLVGRQAAGGSERPADIECHGGRPADQPHRPVQGSLGERVRVLAQKQVLHERAQAVLLRRAPLAAQPRRRREADVQEGDGGEDDKLDGKLDSLIRGTGDYRGADCKHEDADDAREP